MFNTPALNAFSTGCRGALSWPLMAGSYDLIHTQAVNFENVQSKWSHAYI
jgi:hypothetical protein